MSRFEVLRGLPTDGEEPTQYIAAGQGVHREGLAVRFRPATGESWTGSFQPGQSGHDEVIDHPDGTRVLVISGGQGYVVDPGTRDAEHHGAAITGTLRYLEVVILVHQDLWFEAIGKIGRVWRSKRLSLGGFDRLQVDGTFLRGMAWDGGDWVPFRLDLRTGSAEGGWRS